MTNTKIVVDDSTSQGLKFYELKQGDVFQYKEVGGSWYSEVYVMVNPAITKDGQCFSLTDQESTWFEDDSGTLLFRVFETVIVKDPIVSR